MTVDLFTPTRGRLGRATEAPRRQAGAWDLRHKLIRILRRIDRPMTAHEVHQRTSSSRPVALIRETLDELAADGIATCEERVEPTAYGSKFTQVNAYYAMIPAEVVSSSDPHAAEDAEMQARKAKVDEAMRRRAAKGDLKSMIGDIDMPDEVEPESDPAPDNRASIRMAAHKPNLGDIDLSNATAAGKPKLGDIDLSDITAHKMTMGRPTGAGRPPRQQWACLAAATRIHDRGEPMTAITIAAEMGDDKSDASKRVAKLVHQLRKKGQFPYEILTGAAAHAETTPAKPETIGSVAETAPAKPETIRAEPEAIAVAAETAPSSVRLEELVLDRVVERIVERVWAYVMRGGKAC